MAFLVLFGGEMGNGRVFADEKTKEKVKQACASGATVLTAVVCTVVTKQPTACVVGAEVARPFITEPACSKVVELVSPKKK